MYTILAGACLNNVTKLTVHVTLNRKSLEYFYIFQAIVLKLHPLYLMFPSGIAASLAFMLPAATPPNAVAFSYGGIKVKDMVRTEGIT